MDVRVRIFFGVMVLFVVAIIAKMFSLQVVERGFYEALASGQHELFQELFPERGEIFAHDSKDNLLVPVATNQQLASVYADPRRIVDTERTVDALVEILGFNEESRTALLARLGDDEDPYEPIAQAVTDKQLEEILAAKLDGVFYVRTSVRLYPEQRMSGHVLGFLGSDESGQKSGKYGLEGYFDDTLTGTPGFLRSERDIAGRLIALGERSFEPAVDGADLVLTIDRTLQYEACSKLDEAVKKHGADGGSVVIVEPSTGRILAMCGAPDFDPNDYGAVSDIMNLNNPAIFHAYEPGSVFKPITMAAALDVGAVEPTTTFEDTGSATVEGWPEPIQNAEGKSYGLVNMTTVLEASINTGMIFAMRAMGMDTFVKYVKNFGFGSATGIPLETEMPGNISSLDIGGEVYAATASFGQGITVTPLQLAMAYAAIANGGTLLSPLLVEEIRYPDGRTETFASSEVRSVVKEQTARLLGAMLVSVVEYGHGKRAGVPGYYIAGKTGTAQVARTDGLGYDPDVTIGSFAGFGPVSNPRFAMVVRIDRPRDVKWAESTAAPLFGKIADFLLRYLEVPPER